jgi:ubiquinone/menaquinone biosynthesis C-methylase UbiE
MSEHYLPEIYDLANTGSFRGDVEWYRQKARESGGPVLELGAGTGRITLPIAEDGTAIWALDRDRGMLDALRAKCAGLSAEARSHLTVIEGDMRAIRLDMRFPLVIIPFRAFLHNLTEADQLACLQAVYAHLIPGGRIALNVFHPSLEFMAQHAGALAGVWRWVSSRDLPDGGTLIRSDANRYDSVQQHVHSMIRYERFDAAGNLTSTWLQRLELAYLYAGDLKRLLERAGFDQIEIAGAFDGRRFEHDADELVVQAVRA